MTSRPAMAVRGWTEDPGADLQDWLAGGGDPNAWVAIPDYGQIPTLLALGCCGPYTFGLSDREPAIAALLAAGADPNVGFVVEGRQFRPLFSQAIAGRHGMAIAARLLAHGAAVDLWSTGCILAEMILRAPLMAGNDYLNQLQLIIQTLGTPTDAEMATLENEHARQYVRRLPEQKAKSWEEVMPHATPAAQM